jgi:hypothetical protein
MLRASRSLERVQEALGHASPAMTRRYAHVLQEDVPEAKSEAQKGTVTAPEFTRFSTRPAETEGRGVVG